MDLHGHALWLEWSQKRKTVRLDGQDVSRLPFDGRDDVGQRIVACVTCGTEAGQFHEWSCPNGVAESPWCDEEWCPRCSIKKSAQTEKRLLFCACRKG
jgi:hypothetical protein